MPRRLGETGTCLPQLLFAYRTKPHESPGEAPFYLRYGHDARLPTKVAHSMPKSPYRISVEDYQTELTMGLTEAWNKPDSAIKSTGTSEVILQARAIDYQSGGRVMVYMPQENQGKNRKLA